MMTYKVAKYVNIVTLLRGITKYMIYVHHNN